MKLIAFTSFAALLGACSTTPPAATVGTAQVNAAGNIVTVTQDGTNYTLDDANPNSMVTLAKGQTVQKWSTGTAVPAGYVMVSPNSTVIAAGLDNGTYFAGISGTPYDIAPLPTAGTAALSGAYAFIVNGTSQEGALALTADFGAGTLTSTTAGISVNGAIAGTNIAGTMTVTGETGALSGGFYNQFGGYNVAGAVVGTNMAGVFVANQVSKP